MNLDNPTLNFAASKMSNNVRFNVTVQYTDFMGKTHQIVCKSRKQLSEASKFLAIFKSEAKTINQVLSEYPVKLGKFPKKFHSEIKKDLEAKGLICVAKYLLK